MKFHDNAGCHECWQAFPYIMIYPCFRNQLIIIVIHVHALLAFRCTSSRLFKRKPGRRTYRFSWLFFDKWKSWKRSEKVLNHTFRRHILSEWSCHIPCCGVPYASSCFPFKPVSASVFVRFRVWYGVFHALKWAISHSEMVHFMWLKNRFRT